MLQVIFNWGERTYVTVVELMNKSFEHIVDKLFGFIFWIQKCVIYECVAPGLQYNYML